MLVLLLAGCRSVPPPPPPAPARPPAPEPISLATYPTLAASPQGGPALADYLDAWNSHQQGSEKLAQARAALLAAYARAYRSLNDANAAQNYDVRLRMMWDLCGVAHATVLSPARIKAAVGWHEPALPPIARSPLTPTAASHGPLRGRLTDLPPLVLRLLAAVKSDTGGKATFADFVRAQARQVYLTPEIHQWSPACPLDVCGSSEPLSRTLILASVGKIDQQPKPEWKLAAVAVHESAHIQWFYRPEISSDPRLLLPVPNERQAWIMMAGFLRGLSQAQTPALRQYVDQHRPDIESELAQAESQFRQANQILGLSPDDRTVQLKLPAGIATEALRSPLVASVVPAGS